MGRPLGARMRPICGLPWSPVIRAMDACYFAEWPAIPSKALRLALLKRLNR